MRLLLKSADNRGEPFLVPFKTATAVQMANLILLHALTTPYSALGYPGNICTGTGVSVPGTSNATFRSESGVHTIASLPRQHVSPCRR